MGRFRELLDRSQERQMLVKTMRARGFTLVELLVGIAILSLLLLIALRPMTDFIGNVRIRNTADSIASGVRLASVEAIKRNRPVQFILAGGGWRVFDPDPDPNVGGIIQDEPFVDGTLTIAPQPAGTSKLSYSAFGQFLNRNPDDDSEPLRRVDVSSPAMDTNQTNLRVVIDPLIGVGVRVCNPDIAKSEADGCP
jgi:type IV fimbrial biogenesis protein FimT